MGDRETVQAYGGRRTTRSSLKFIDLHAAFYKSHSCASVVSITLTCSKSGFRRRGWICQPRVVIFVNHSLVIVSFVLEASSTLLTSRTRLRELEVVPERP